MLTFSTEPCGVTSSSSFDAEAVVLKVRKFKITRLNFVGFGAQDPCFTPARATDTQKLNP